MDIPVHVRQILESLGRSGYPAYPVGGCVRDSLLGQSPADWDVCTAALPAQTEAALPGLRFVETGMKHGTVTALTEGGPVEVTTFRRDGAYLDGRHPEEVSFRAGLEEDLARRDFTVNAMALAPDGAVIDPFGGQADLAAGIIRCVGDPSARFGEDALRILRALRFAARLDFQIEPDTAGALLARRELLERISPERIFKELTGLLPGPGAGRMLRDFAPVFYVFMPELAPQQGFWQNNPNHIHDIWTHTTMAVDAIAPDPVLRLTMLLHDIGKPARYFTDEVGVGHFYGHAETGASMADELLRRLRCDNATRRHVMLLIEYHDIEPPQTEKGARRLLAKLGEDTCRQLLACWRADSDDRGQAVRERNLAVIGRSEQAMESVLAREQCFSKRDMAVNGRDILALGVPEGPAVGRILETLFQQVLSGELSNERGPLLEQAARLWEESLPAQPRQH
ncbi:MAG: HDIG domain-containing protein [Oscillospiraceae bacterium]|nr:HDIG domain-containing protein [Oscillospiraceae bacterium]